MARAVEASVEPAAADHPRLTTALVGQQEAEAAILRAWQHRRMPHAWLIGGPRGVGKATLAYRAARFVLAGGAESGPSAPGLFGDPDERPHGLAVARDSRSFRLVAASGHPDLMTIERPWDDKRKKRKGEIGVDQVRDLAGFLHLTASGGGWRVVIVDAADEMNRNAANALLKALEEPPPRSVLFLVAHAPGRLLPTIRSRCRRLALPPLSVATVDALLADRRPELPAEDRTVVAALAEGSIGDALDLADAGGQSLHAELCRMLAALPQLDPIGLQGFADGLAKSGDDTAWTTCRMLLRAILRRMVSRAATAAEAGPAAVVPEPEGSLAPRLLARAGGAAWGDAALAIETLFAQTDGLNLDRRQAALQMFFILRDTAAGRRVG